MAAERFLETSKFASEELQSYNSIGKGGMDWSLVKIKIEKIYSKAN